MLFYHKNQMQSIALEKNAECGKHCICFLSESGTRKRLDKLIYPCYNTQALRGVPQYRGVEQLEARRAHNPEVVGSSPASATKKKPHPSGWGFFLVMIACFAAITRVMSPTSVARCGLNGFALPGADTAKPFSVQRSVCNAAGLSARRTQGTANRATEPMQKDYPVRLTSSPASATNNAHRKRYRCEKPRNHCGFGVLLCFSKSEIQKISFSPNDLWEGLERNTKTVLGRKNCTYMI